MRLSKFSSRWGQEAQGERMREEGKIAAGELGAGVDGLAAGSVPSPGTLLCGRYRLESTIAQGATALLYRAVDELLDDVCAVKLVLHDGLLAAPEAREIHLGLREEAHLAMRLTHPNILRVYTYERHAPWEFLAMEFVAGQDLFEGQNQRRGRRYSIRETIRVGVECLDALAYAHGAGVLHNDVKPRNILETRAGSIKLCDFGLAGFAAVQALARRSSVAVPVIGTPAFMSPERIRGDSCDARSDLYSLAATLWTLATGRAPFGSDDSALFHHVHSALPESPFLPRELSDVLRVALAKRPADRHPSALAMRDALLDVLARIGPGLYAVPDSPQAPAPAVEDTPVEEDGIDISLELDPELDGTEVCRASVAERANMVHIGARELRSAYGGTFAVRPFYIDRTPVTNAQYGRFLQATGAAAPPSWLAGRPPSGQEEHPVVDVTVDEARSYAAWAGKRLPSSVEWETAARGPNQTAFPWGNEWRPELAVCREAGSTGTVPVGTVGQAASPDGVFDAVGNVWEWTEPDVRCPPEPESAWVLGGSFRHACNADGRIARTSVGVVSAYEYLGFRCALDEEEDG